MSSSIKNTYRFSSRCQNIPSSFIRDILKVADQKDIISFAGGLPDPSLFPAKELEESTSEVFEHHRYQMLQYGKSEGLPALKNWICHYYFQQYRMKINPDQLLIVNGSQQALDLVGKAFLDPGDHLVMEQPSYLGAIQAFMAYQPEILSINIEQDGLDLRDLELVLTENNPKLLYLVSNFQNPSGFTISQEKRMALAQLAKRHQLIIVEDDPYGALRFEGEHLKPIRSYYNDTIHCGSFSKIIAPGLRLGWILSNETIIQKLLVLKQASDLHSNNLSQYIIDHFLRNFSLGDHLERIKNNYRQKCQIMFSAAKKAFPQESIIGKPEGGMFLWVALPDKMNAEAILKEAMKEKVLFVPGKYFFTNGKGENTLRLNFTNSSFQNIEKGIAIIGKVIEKIYGVPAKPVKAIKHNEREAYLVMNK